MYRLLHPLIACLYATTCLAQDQQPQPPHKAPDGPKEIGATFKELRKYFRANPLDFRTSFTANSGFRRTIQGSTHFLIQEPNLFRIETTSGDDTYVAISDGRVMRIYNPREQKFAEWPAPDTFRGGLNLISGLMTRESQVLRFITLLEAAASGGLLIGAVGSEKVAGRRCDRFNIQESEKKVWKVWLEQSEVPLPCKIVTEIQTSEFNWKPNPVFPSDTFVFTPPKGSTKVDVNDLGLRHR